MYMYSLVLYSMLNNVDAEADDCIIVDYFEYKQIPRVAGYSCNALKDDFLLIKKFSSKGMSASVFKLGNESNIEKIGKTRYWKTGLFLDVRCYAVKNIAAIFITATDYRMYDELHDWFVLGDDLNNVLKLIDDRAFGLSTNFMIAISNGGENYKLYDVYNRHKDRGSTLNITFYGSWNKQNSLIINLTQPKMDRRSNFHNLKLKTMFYKTMDKPDNMTLTEYYKKSPNGIREALSKYGFSILEHLSDLYNFSIECFETDILKPGDGLGPLVRSLVDFQADLAGTPLTMSINRSYLLKYVHMGLPLRTCFIFRNPQPTTIKVREIFRPFANSVWYFTCIIIIIFAMILSFTLGFDQNYNVFIRMSNSIIIVIGAICQQNSDFYFSNYSTRIVFTCILLFSLILYDYYSASVVSARLDEPIYKINDSLVEFGKLHLRMASEKIVYINIFWKAPIWETQVFYQKYWINIPENKRYMDPEKGMRLVQKRGFAYHVHPDMGYIFIEKYFNNREICELMEVHLGRPQNTMFGVMNNCTFEEILRVGLTKISEVGLRKRQHQKWHYRKPLCRKDILTASSINMYEFAPYLILLVAGMLLSVLMYTFEVITFQWVIKLRFNTDRKTEDFQS